jgi:hypothetical protein
MMNRTEAPKREVPKPKVRKRLPHDYEARKANPVTPRSLAAEYAELRTRTPGQRG